MTPLSRLQNTIRRSYGTLVCTLASPGNYKHDLLFFDFPTRLRSSDSYSMEIKTFHLSFYETSFLRLLSKNKRGNIFRYGLS